MHVDDTTTICEKLFHLNQPGGTLSLLDVKLVLPHGTTSSKRPLHPHHFEITTSFSMFSRPNNSFNTSIIPLFPHVFLTKCHKIMLTLW